MLVLHWSMGYATCTYMLKDRNDKKNIFLKQLHLKHVTHRYKKWNRNNLCLIVVYIKMFKGCDSNFEVKFTIPPINMHLCYTISYLFKQNDPPVINLSLETQVSHKMKPYELIFDVVMTTCSLIIHVL